MKKNTRIFDKSIDKSYKTSKTSYFDRREPPKKSYTELGRQRFLAKSQRSVKNTPKTGNTPSPYGVSKYQKTHVSKKEASETIHTSAFDTIVKDRVSPKRKNVNYAPYQTRGLVSREPREINVDDSPKYRKKSPQLSKQKVSSPEPKKVKKSKKKKRFKAVGPLKNFSRSKFRKYIEMNLDTALIMLEDLNLQKNKDKYKGARGSPLRIQDTHPSVEESHF